jgi:hypothetical protein
MRKTISIALVLTTIILGSLAFRPEGAKAGDPGSQRGDGPNAFQYCLHETGDKTYYRCRPRNCSVGIRSGCGSSSTAPSVKDSKPNSRTTKLNLSEPEMRERTISATLLSVLALIAGLSGVILCGKKLLRPAPGFPARQGHRDGRMRLPQWAFSFVAGIVITGLVAGLWLSTTNTHSFFAPPVSARGASTLQAGGAAPKFSAAVSIAGTGHTQISGLAVDQAGNTYVAGGFSGSITFNTMPQPTTLTRSEDYEVFIAKYSPAGQPLWARVANGATGLSFTDPDANVTERFSYDGALAVAVDAQGNIYVGGGFVKSLSFKDAGGNTVATLNDDSEAESDEINFELFVAKYDVSGTLLWARGGESGALDDSEAEEDLDSGINGINEIVVDKAGNPYVAGTFSGTNFLGQEITSEGGRDILLSRLDPATGAPVWVATPGSANTDSVMGLAVDDAANLYLIGDVGGTITFPTQPSATTFLLEDEFGDSFVAKYNQHGQALWAKQIGGTQPIDGEHIAVSGAGYIYLTGAFEGEARFDSITVTDPSNGSGSSGFLAKYSTDGNALWVRSFGRTDGETSEGDVLGYRVSVDGAGNPFVYGIFESEATFGQEALQTAQTLASDRLEDQFVAHYDAAGNFRWVKHPTQSGADSQFIVTDEDFPIEVLPLRLVYNDAAKTLTLTGAIQDTLTLDDITLQSGNFAAAFIATLPVCSPLALSKSDASFAANGGAGSFTVTTSTGCPWSATTSSSFIHLTAPRPTASGTQTVSYTVDSNNSATRRSGTIELSGQTFTVWQGPQFIDVALNHQFYDFIGKLAARGITLGCGGGAYCPEANVTREQIAIFIERALGVFTPPAGPVTPSFADVPNSGVTDYSYEFIEDFAARGITLGCAAGPPRLYCPTANMTREQVAVFILRALGVFTPPAGPVTPTFADVPNSGATDASHEFIEEFYRRGITQGCTAGPPRLYCPGSPVTRGQMAVFLVRAFNL